MPQVGLGTWKSEPGQVKAAVISAIEAGYRHIDCAAGYGNEHEVGAALSECFARGIVKREDIFVTSKLWVAKCFTDMVVPALEKTLADLQLTYLDLYLVVRAARARGGWGWGGVRARVLAGGASTRAAALHPTLPVVTPVARPP